MKTMNRLFLIALASIAAVNTVSSQIGLNKLAQSTMNFLLVSTSPRAAGMGEAFSTLGTGADAIFYNPAGLAAMKGSFDASVDVTQWIADITYFNAKAAYNLGTYGSVGVHFLTVDYGDIIGTSLLTASENSVYKLGYRETGLVSNVGAYSLGVTYAIFINTQFGVGGTVKYAGQKLGETVMTSGVKQNDATKFVFDAGIRYLTGFKSFAFGMNIRNFSSNIKREEITEQLPLSFVLGGSLDLLDFIDPGHDKETGCSIGVDFLHQNNYSERVNLGLEYRVFKELALRGGYQTNRDVASWSAGIGLNTSIDDYTIDLNYSFSKFDIFKDVNRFSIGGSF
jgi:hypothetical protein